jgi:hypothetical protein
MVPGLFPHSAPRALPLGRSLSSAQNSTTLLPVETPDQPRGPQWLTASLRVNAAERSGHHREVCESPQRARVTCRTHAGRSWVASYRRLRSLVCSPLRYPTIDPIARRWPSQARSGFDATQRTRNFVFNPKVMAWPSQVPRADNGTPWVFPDVPPTLTQPWITHGTCGLRPLRCTGPVLPQSKCGCRAALTLRGGGRGSGGLRFVVRQQVTGAGHCRL